MICVSICEVVAYSFPLLCIHCGTITESPFSPTGTRGFRNVVAPGNSLFGPFQLPNL